VGPIPASINIRWEPVRRPPCALPVQSVRWSRSAFRPVRAGQWSLSRSCRGSPVRPPSEMEATLYART